MVSLCPHLIEVYFEKTHEIMSTYEAQIMEQVTYGHIAEGLIFRKVLSQSQNAKILQLADGTNQMEETIEIIKKRVWGLENFIIVLMEEKCNPWLVEKLHESYNKYLLVEMQKQKSLECDCPRESTLMSTLNKQWMTFLTTVDKFLYETGTSIGFVNQTIFPTRNLLSFINDRLPIPKRLRAPHRQAIEMPEQSLKAVVQSSSKILNLDKQTDSKAIEFVLTERNVSTSPIIGSNSIASYSRENLNHSEYSESEGTDFSGASFTQDDNDHEETVGSISEDDMEFDKQDFRFSRSKSASAEALYRKDITQLLNFHDLTDEMLEWDEESETPEFTNQILLSSPLAMPTFDAGTQTTTSTE